MPARIALLTLALALATAPVPAAPKLECADDGSSLTLKQDGVTALSFRHALLPPPEGQSPLFTRGGFIHPLRTPSGEVLTGIHPADHIHHLGVWNPWTRTQCEGRKTDYWNLKEGQGTVRMASIEKTWQEEQGTGFAARLDFVDLKAPGGPRVTLHERQKVALRPVPDTLPRGFLVAIESEQWCATNQAFTVEKYRYGGFSFRARTDWKTANSDYLTSEGKTRADGNSTRARWVRMQGTVDGKTCGLLAISHPANFNHPEPIRIWPASDHGGMVFFNFNPAQDRNWVLEPGQHYIRRYFLFTYDGELSAEQAEAVWRHCTR